jgi:hypothetical protein
VPRSVFLFSIFNSVFQHYILRKQCMAHSTNSWCFLKVKYTQ